MIEGADFFVRLVDLPCAIGGMVTPNEDGTYSVYLNARRTRAQNRASADHEVRHMALDDLYSDRSIEEVEGW